MKRRGGARGFTYLGLIILLAVMGMVAAAGLKMGTLLQRAAAEEELLEIGAQFSEALRSYAAATPQGKPQQPPSLQDLLKDPRFPTPRRHLRKIFVDPVTGKAEWGIVWLGDKVGVIAVHSLSAAKPLKVANFDIRFQNMENREHLSDWKFGMAGGALQPAVVTPANSMTGSAPGAAPSLFAPGSGGESTGTKGGQPLDPAAAGGKGGEGAPPAGGKAMEPPAPEAAPEAPAAAESEPEPEAPMETQSDEEKEAEAAREKAEAEEKEKEDNSTSSTTKPPPGTPPPPENRVRRR